MLNQVKLKRIPNLKANFSEELDNGDSTKSQSLKIKVATRHPKKQLFSFDFSLCETKFNNLFFNLGRKQTLVVTFSIVEHPTYMLNTWLSHRRAIDFGVDEAGALCNQYKIYNNVKHLILFI